MTEPWQLEDIGFLCHFRDPDNYSLELLQHTFAPPAGAGPQPAADGEALWERWHLGQISIRSSCARRLLSFYRRLGMTHLASMKVQRSRFDIHFMAFAGDASIPDDDVYAATNREWMYRQGFTQIEIRDDWSPVAPGTYACDARRNWAGITIAVPDLDAVLQRLSKADEEPSIADGHRTVLLHDPDGFPVRLAQTLAR